MFFELDKLKHINNNMVIFGVVYSVIWTFIVYFIWDNSPEIFTILDTVTDLILIHMAFDIYRKGSFQLRKSLILRLAQLFSLAYATIWTVIIMMTLEIDIDELLFPLDLISLYATITLSLAIWKTLRTR